MTNSKYFTLKGLKIEVLDESLKHLVAAQEELITLNGKNSQGKKQHLRKPLCENGIILCKDLKRFAAKQDVKKKASHLLELFTDEIKVGTY